MLVALTSSRRRWLVEGNLATPYPANREKVLNDRHERPAVYRQGGTQAKEQQQRPDKTLVIFTFRAKEVDEGTR